MSLMAFAMVVLSTATLFAAGIFAGGMVACWEESRNKNLAGKTNRKDRERSTA